MKQNFDVLVLGAGNAGIAAAGIARNAGLSVAIIENRDVGGTCPIRGCVPKKVLVAAAQVLDQIEKAKDHHIKLAGKSLDWKRLIEREQGFVKGVSSDFKASLKKQGISLVEGDARFVGKNEIEVGQNIFSGGKIIIATGSVPRKLPIPGWEHTITSDDILEMTDLPKTLAFIGAGVISMEFAHVLTRAGTKVTILEALPTILSREDTDAVAALRKETERLGINVLTDVKIKKITPHNGQVKVSYEQAVQERELTVEAAANGAGRVAAVEALDLDAGGVAHKEFRIDVDENLKSVSNPSVYVAGDAAWATAQLSPLATYEGRIVGENIVNNDTLKPDYSSIPSVVFTVPALARVGLREDDAKDKGLDFETKINDMGKWRSAKTHAERVAFSKVLVEKGTGKILGAHLVGHGAEEVIHLFAFAIKFGIKAKDLAAGVYAYPTFSSDIKYLV